MKLNIILLVCLLILVSRADGECTSDCANGWKIITDVFYCKGIFGDPNCNADATCLQDFAKYKECAFTGCFGDMSNLSDINEYNNCL